MWLTRLKHGRGSGRTQAGGDGRALSTPLREDDPWEGVGTGALDMSQEVRL